MSKRAIPHLQSSPPVAFPYGTYEPATGPVKHRLYVAKQPRAKGGTAAKLARPFRPHPPL
jgi:hypothetical protein